MEKKEYVRPDETAVFRILDANHKLLAETLILCAWKLGLSREEIHHLKWEHISFADQRVTLMDRVIPMDEDTSQRLYERWQGRGQRCEYVAASDRTAEHVHKVYISTHVRKVLDEGGLPEVDLKGLRHDFVIRQLETHDWTYVSRITGLAATTLFAAYPQYVQSIRGKQKPPKIDVRTEEEALNAILEEEGTSVAGLTMRMCLEMGLNLQTIAALTWEQVDLRDEMIHNQDESLPISAALKVLLAEVQASRSQGDDPHVLLTPRARTPFTDARLSTLVKRALIRGGVENLSAADLQRKKQNRDRGDPILRRVEEQGYMTRKDVMEQMGLSSYQAYNVLQKLVDQKRLSKVGIRYYPFGTVVSDPEEQYAAIRAYLEDAGGAYRQEIMDLLHLEAKQCTWILHGLVSAGKLEKVGQRYRLPSARKS